MKNKRWRKNKKKNLGNALKYEQRQEIDNKYIHIYIYIYI